MPLAYQDLSDDIRLVTLDGRLDIAGTDAVSTRYGAITGATGKRLIIDLSAVAFLGSIGIRLLLSNAKATQQRGGRTLLLVTGNESVARTLEVSGMGALMPMFGSLDAARAAAQA
jgi:anti-anti-sigma factor